MEIGNSVVADSTQPNLLSETVRAIDLNSTQNRRWFSASRVPSTPDLSLDSSVLPVPSALTHMHSVDWFVDSTKAACCL
jgi:hypothetical protein